MNLYLISAVLLLVVVIVLIVLLMNKGKEVPQLKLKVADLESQLGNTMSLIDERLKLSDKYSKLLASVAEKTFEAVIITDKEGTIEWVNSGFTTITGYSFDEVKGKKPGSFLQGNETDRNTVDRIRTKLKENKIFKEEIINYSKDGRKYWLSISITPILDKNGNVEKFIAIESDITESKSQKDQLEKQLREALKK
ncbi:hypothetical protein BH11BAC1_BH11BAC1_29190 [soil metagenome]